MHSLASDLRLGVRLLLKTPGFTLIALLALALGMGATTAIFSVVDAVLLRPLPYRDPERLLIVWEKNPAQGKYRLFTAGTNFRQLQQRSHTLEGMAAVQEVNVNLTGGPNGRMEPEELHAERVTFELFAVLGVQPVVGRAFRADEDQPGHANYVLISHRLWERRFASDPAIAGKSIRLRDQNYTVTGVLPAGFSVINPSTDVWVPLALNLADPRMANARMLMGVGRLRPRTTLEQARAEMEGIGDGLERENPGFNAGLRPSLFPFRDELVGNTRDALLVLFGAVGFLLLMACLNVANLLLARGSSRRKEIAIRNAMGATRGRLMLQLLTESLVLSLLGGAIGLLIARVSVTFFASLGAQSIPLLANARLDGRLFLFALAVSVGTGILFGIVPAIQISGSNLNVALVEGGRGGTSGRRGRLMRSSIVVLEIALSLVVLVGAGLLIRSFVRLRSTDPGFQPSNLLTFRLQLGNTRYADEARRSSFLQQVSDRMAVLPGVRSVGVVNTLPLMGLGGGSTYTPVGRPVPPPDRRPMGLVRAVSPAYFRTMGIPLLAGRWLTAEDTAQSTFAVVVNQTLVRKEFPQEQPLGQHLTLWNAPNGRQVEIVGVVGDVKPDRVETDDWPTIYCPYTQMPAFTAVFVMKTEGAPLSLATAVERAVHQIDPDQPVADIRPMGALVEKSLAGSRFNAVLLGIFAFIAFALAAVGIYGVVSYDANQRIQEIGLRMALGAQHSDVLQLILKQGARLAAFGIASGLAAALALTRLMATMLFGVKPTDALTFGGISVLLGIVALAACYLPARRAMALDPVTALRHE
jgi:putative ABC transport system permease protein